MIFKAAILFIPILAYELSQVYFLRSTRIDSIELSHIFLEFYFVLDYLFKILSLLCFLLGFHLLLNHYVFGVHGASWAVFIGYL